MYIGQIIGTGLFLYFLFGLTIIVPIVGITYLFRSRQLYTSGYRSKVLLSLELMFGLIQPLLYLIFLFPALWDTDHLWVQVLHYGSFIVLGSVWLSRCLPAELISADRKKRLIRTASLLCFGTIAIHAGIGLTKTPVFPLNDALIFYPVVSIHYLIPILMAFRYGHLARQNNDTAKVFYFFKQEQRQSRWPEKILITISAVVATVPLLAIVSSSKSDARIFIEDHRDQIVKAARENSIDPVLLAAVAYTARHRTTLWKPAFERLVMGIWLADAKSHFLLSKSMDLSIGPTQIKPTTAQTALIIYGTALHQIEYQKKVAAGTAGKNDQYYFHEFFKEYRDAWHPTTNWHLSRSSLYKLTLPAKKQPDKETLVNDLTDPEKSLQYCAFILGLYAAQWDELLPGSPIRNDPAIIATLYQIGFQKSKPHEAPKASRFGAAAALAAKEDWLKKLF